MDKLLSLMSKLPEERQEELKKLLVNAPYWLIEEFRVVKLAKNQVFIRSGEPASRVYILLSGNVKASDYGIYDVVYDYTWFEPIEIFGAMEFYMDYDAYITTLVTMTGCVLLEISRDLFQKWLKSDADVILRQVKDMMRRLNDQSKKERVFLFLNGTERLMYFLAMMYRQHAKDGVCTIRLTKEELGNYSGINIRTVNRAIRQMLEEHMIQKEGRTLSIDENGFHMLEERLIQKTK